MITKIWTDDEELLVDTEDIEELESAMRFKAEHIRAKADPELFAAVAGILSSMWDTASKAIDPVKHGHWIVEELNNTSPNIRCSNCKSVMYKPIINYYYCPFCGAKTDEEVSG